MDIVRYQTVGAVAPDLSALSDLAGRLEGTGLDAASLVVVSRRRDEGAVKVTLPEAEVRTVERGLSRAQWLELGSAYLGVTAVSVLMGAVHLPTGIVVQAVMTLAVIVGLVVYFRRPQVARTVTALGLPTQVAQRWEAGFKDGLALVLMAVPEEDLEAAQDAFLEDDSLVAVLAVDRRPVF